MTDGIVHAEERLEQIASELKKNNIVPSVTTREFMSWFGAKRRGYWVVAGIREDLGRAGLRTFPDFRSNYIDAQLGFALVDTSTAERDEEVAEVDDGDSNSELSDAKAATGTAFDAPSYRVSRLEAANLEAANKVLTLVRPDASLREAMTLMMLNDFSQLPVMIGEREVKGVISWGSIGARLAIGATNASQNEHFVRDFMEPHHEIGISASLFSAIDVIVQQQYVLVRGLDNRITGIVTATDLSLQFRLLTEPFLLLGEVENHLRKLLSSRFSQSELAAACNEEGRIVDGVSDLSFGEYQRLLEKPANWAKLGINVDRVTFGKKLDKVREIRNDVMHFDPDGVLPDDLRELREFAQFLRLLDSVQASGAPA